MPGTGGGEKTIRSVVTLVQEGRFQLRCEDGVHRVSVLAHDAAVEPQDLPRLLRGAGPVDVRYVEARHLVAFASRDEKDLWFKESAL